MIKITNQIRVSLIQLSIVITFKYLYVIMINASNFINLMMNDFQRNSRSDIQGRLITVAISV